MYQFSTRLSNLFKYSLRTFCVAALLCFAASAHGQTAVQYGFSTPSGTFTELVGGTNVSAIQADDQYVNNIPIGFTFNFCGSNYTAVAPCSNGWMKFGTGNGSYLTNDATAGNLGNVAPAVLPLWDDLDGATGQTPTSYASYLTTGTAPNRVFTFEWRNWQWNFSSNVVVISFQVKLYETSNQIDFVYRQEANAANIPSATIGIANSLTDYQTLNGATATPTASSTTFNTSIATKPPTNQVYRWSPPPPCSGAPVASPVTAPSAACPNTPFSINVFVGGTGQTYLWESSTTSATGPFVSTGVTTSVYTSPGITVPTWYRVTVTCAASNQSTTSNVVFVGLNNWMNCYCIPTYTNGGGADYIASVTLLNLSHNTGALANPAPYYRDYTTLQPGTLNIPTLTIGIVDTVTVTFGADGSQYTRVWIDFDHSGTFGTNESFTLGTNAGGNGTAKIPLPIPTGAQLGITRMRIRGADDSQPSDTQPCNASNSTFGEAEDYLVNIIGPPPPPTVVNNGPICAGNPITITATSTAPGTLSYTLTGGPGVTAPVPSSTGVFTVTATTSGTYSVTVTSFGFTSPAGTTVFTLQPSPTIAQGAITSPTSCGGANGSITLTGLQPNATYTLNYSRNGFPATTSTVVADANGVVTMGGLSAASYTQIRLTNSSNCTSNSLGPIGVNDPNPPVPPTASYNPPLCLGSTLVLSASSIYSNATYTWTGPGLSPTTGTTVTRPNLQYIDTGLYSVTVTVAGCISAPGTVRVFINPPPAAPTTTAVSFCQFSTATPLTATGQNLRWYTAATGGTALPSAPVPNTTVAGNQTFYVSQTANTCEGPRASLVVTIKARPDVPLSDTARELCQYQAAPALTATGSSILWYATATGAGGSTAAPVPATTAPGVYFFYVTQTVNGCESERLRIRVTVKPKPAPPVVVSPLRLCQYEGADPLTAQGQNLLWYNVPNGGGALPGTPTPPTAYEDTTAFYVSQTVNGCESDRALLTVTVNYKPNATILASKEFVCQYDTIAFNYFGNGRTSAQYNWSVEGPGQILSGQGTQGPVLVSYTAPGYYAIRLVVDNNGCLSPVTTKVIEVRAQPRFRIAMQPEGCEDQPIDIVATGATAGIDSFRWDFGGGVPVSGSFNGGPYTVSWEDAGVKVVSVQVLTRECGSAMTYDTIRIEETPVASIGRVSNGAVCDGDTVRLTAQYNPAYTYNWSPAAFFGGSRASTVDALISKTGYVGLEVVTGIGCRATDSVLLSVKSCCEVFVPTAFSPNGDGNNDRFRVVSGGFQSLSAFRVTNRWGRTVWETGAQSGGWDGTVNGAAADMGTYFWYLKYTCTDGKIYEKQGEVTLVR